MTQHQEAIEWARRHLGEHEQPLGSNRGPFVQLCQSQTWLAGTGWPWCAAFCVAAWKLGAKVTLPYRGAGAYAWLDWAKKTGWDRPIRGLVPGDFVVFNIGSGHIGMFESFNPSTGLVTTVDGNVSHKVDRRIRPQSTVRGGIHIPERRPAGQVPAKPPRFEVVTSESGHSQVIYVSSAKAISKRLDRFLAKHGKITIRRKKKR